MTQTATETAADGLFDSYVQLTKNLCDDVIGICLLHGDLAVRGAYGRIDASQVRDWLGSLRWEKKATRSPASTASGSGHSLTAIPIQQSDGTLLGVWCLSQATPGRTENAEGRTRGLLQRLKPALDSLHRELTAAAPRQGPIGRIGPIYHHINDRRRFGGDSSRTIRRPTA